MKRYKIAVDAEAMTNPYRVKAIPSPEGEWVRHEEVSRFVELAVHANDPECYCDDINDGEDPQMCLTCQYQEAVAEFQNAT